MKSLKWLFFAAALIMAAVLAAGCGGQAPKDGGKAAAPARQKVVLASDTAYAPFEFQDTSTGKYIGFDMDLVQAIGEVANLDIEVKSMNFDGIIPALESASVDGAISAMTITEERAKSVLFSDPYYLSNQSILVKADNNTIKSADDLKGKKIGVQISTTGAMKAREIPDAKITDYNTINEAFLALKNGVVDAVVNDYPVNYYFIQQGNKDVKIVAEIKTDEYYGIAFPKSKPEMRDKFNSALKTLKQNGKYAELYKKWFGQNPPDYLPGQPPKK